MKKLIAVTLILVGLCGVAHAQEKNMGSMRSVLVETLMEYGSALYVRQEYPQAQAVFAHVLTIAPNHVKAQKYLDLINPAPVVRPLKPVKTIQIPKAIPVISVYDDQDLSVEQLKQLIAQKEKAIDALKEEISETTIQK